MLYVKLTSTVIHFDLIYLFIGLFMLLSRHLITAKQILTVHTIFRGQQSTVSLNLLFRMLF